MDRTQHTHSLRAISTAVVSAIVFTSSAFASGSVSVDSPELQKGYSTYSNFTESKYSSYVTYSDATIGKVSGALKTGKIDWFPIDMGSIVANGGNNGEKFYFSTPQFSDAKTFTSTGNLLDLWQMGNETVRGDITNKAKFGIYSNILLTLRRNYAVVQGEIHLKWQDLSDLEKSNTDSVAATRNAIPKDFLISDNLSGVSSIGYLLQPPEIAPTHVYTDDQYARYKRFETSVLTVGKKIQGINNKKTLASLDSALSKVLKNGKTIMKDNDKYALYMLVYQMVVEQEQK